MEYSVLMSVYAKENPEYLYESIKSIFKQTFLTNDFVLVCDGPLNKDLDTIIEQYEQMYRPLFHVIRLEKNVGLGCALNIGLQYCKNEIVARMDSDDICCENRCEKQFTALLADEKIDMISSNVLEFSEKTSNVIGQRRVPEKHEDICAYSKKRNPFNHPAIMFKKSAVIRAGGYKGDFLFFEDYFLWVRMLMNGSKGYNIQTPLLFMRTTEALYTRRGGVEYAKRMLHFRRWMKEVHWITNTDVFLGVLPHLIVCLLPNKIRKSLYLLLHR